MTDAGPDNTDTDGGSPVAGPEAVVIYWRRGCPFCMRLMRACRRAGVKTELRDIWADDEARRFVADHNGGDETVPTVVVGDRVSTNPDPRRLIEWLRATHPTLVDDEPEVDGGGRQGRLRLFGGD